MTLLEKVDAILEVKQLKRAALARLGGFTESRLSRWFNGEGMPTVYQAKTIAEVLDVPLEWLADDTQGLPPPATTLSDKQRMILHLTSVIGEDEAIRRLADPEGTPRAVPGQQAPAHAQDFIRKRQKP